MARPNFVEKTFAGDSKTAKFVKVFSLESFPLYGKLRFGSLLTPLIVEVTGYSLLDVDYPSHET